MLGVDRDSSGEPESRQGLSRGQTVIFLCDLAKRSQTDDAGRDQKRL